MLDEVQVVDFTAMSLALTSLAYPLRIVSRIAYCKLTNRKRSFKNEEWLELVFAICSFIWLCDFLGYVLVQKANGHGAIPGLKTCYIGSVVLENASGLEDEDGVKWFKMNFLLAVVAACFWFKVLMMLQLTKTFGPMIKIIVSLLKELATFTVLWVTQLFIFACIGYLVFGELFEYRDLQNTLILLLQASLGQWDLRIYDNLEIGPMYGVGFQVVVMIINTLLFLNLVIAILTETYVRFAKVQLGLYYDGVVDAISNLKYDKKYGAMITAIPPFNVILFFATPLLFLTKNPRKIKKINQVLTQLTYLPIALFLIVVFSAGNILMIPFAYAFALTHKIKLCISDRVYQERKKLWKDLGLFLIMGLVYLSLSQVKDVYYFAVQLYQWKMEKLD